MKKRILIVSEGSPGHLSQSEGLARMIGERIEIEVERIETRHRFGGLVRQLVNTWMGRSGKRLPDGFLSQFLDCNPTDIERPDLILASGGKAVFAAKSLAQSLDAPLVFIGERKPFPSEWFDLVLTPSPFEAGVNDVAIEWIPTTMDPQTVADAANRWDEQPDGRLWALVIGGSSKSHHYHSDDWQQLGEAANQLAKQHGIRWLLSTSRRTGAAAEAALKSAIDPSGIADAVWWSEAPQKKLAAYLGSSERVFVTQDSVTMVTEAVSSGAPTVALYPRDVRLPDTSFLGAYYTRLADHRRMARLPIDRLASAAVTEFDIVPATAADSQRLADIVVDKFFAPDPT